MLGILVHEWAPHSVLTEILPTTAYRGIDSVDREYERIVRRLLGHTRTEANVVLDGAGLSMVPMGR